MAVYNCSKCPGYCCSYPIIPLKKRDVQRLAARMRARLQGVMLRANFQIQVLSNLFFRNKGAYLVGRIISGYSELPLAIPILHDGNGHIKLCDFSCCKCFDETGTQNARTFTYIGTPRYMAPEMRSRAGHSFAVDWWSAGVVLAELICSTILRLDGDAGSSAGSEDGRLDSVSALLEERLPGPSKLKALIRLRKREAIIRLCSTTYKFACVRTEACSASMRRRGWAQARGAKKSEWTLWSDGQSKAM